jgi:hypothetical protein
MIEIDVKADVRAATRWLDNVQRKQIPFALSYAINETAKEVQGGLAKEMSVFDRPKPATVKGTFIKRSTKANLEAVIGLKTRAQGTPTSEYLNAQINPGRREDKRSEILLQRAGILPAGYQTRPGSGARLDAYGNMSRGQIVQILSYFQTFGGIRESGRFKGKTTKSRAINRTGAATGKYFIVPDGYAGLATGVWKRQGRKIEPILIFIKPAIYRKRYDFYGVANKIVRTGFVRQFDKALQYALATAR